MSSFKQKLARMPAFEPAERPVAAPALPVDDELGAVRARLARVLGPTVAAPRPAEGRDGLRDEAFRVEETPHGPLHVRRALSEAGARVGRVALETAERADPALLALLALDPALAGCAPERALFMDTETSGLAGGAGTVAFLLGLSWRDEASGRWMLEQALLRQLGEEAPLLALFAERLGRASMLVTYNGKSFDWPLLRTRFVMNRMTPPEPPPHLDLVHVARRLHRARLTSCSLVAVEDQVLGRARVGDVPGAEIVAIYAHYLRTGDAAALGGVVEHNAADVLAMVALVGLYGEELASLAARDLVGAARTLGRAGAPGRAAALAEQAVEQGGGAEALRARGDLARARGDKASALADYERVVASVDDPRTRLVLAKLYEHHVRRPAEALRMLELGTSEPEAASLRRRARLTRKLART
jgi:uncharacterized protein YprB with RNaseH-like and TPR domain